MTINLTANIWSWDSLWQTGSVIASIFLFLGLTHQSWLPDVVSGFFILHKRYIDMGDVIEVKIDGDLIKGYVGKITLIDTTIHDLRLKKPYYIRNSIIRDNVIMIASESNSKTDDDAILQSIDIKLGYDVKVKDVEENFAPLLFEQAMEYTKSINKKKGIRMEIAENGDFGVLWQAYYYCNARNMVEAEFAMNKAAKRVSEDNPMFGLTTPDLLTINKV